MSGCCFRNIFLARHCEKHWRYKEQDRRGPLAHGEVPEEFYGGFYLIIFLTNFANELQFFELSSQIHFFWGGGTGLYLAMPGNMGYWRSKPASCKAHSLTFDPHLCLWVWAAIGELGWKSRTALYLTNPIKLGLNPQLHIALEKCWDWTLNKEPGLGLEHTHTKKQLNKVVREDSIEVTFKSRAKRRETYG